MGPHHDDRAGRPVVGAVVAAAVAVAVALAGGTAALTGDSGGTGEAGTTTGTSGAGEPTAGRPAAPSGAATTTTTARAEHPLVAAVAEYDRLYGAIVADRHVLYDAPGHRLHDAIADVLTAGSPLRPVRIWTEGTDWRDDPAAVRAAQTVPPGPLAPGERRAALPIVHELLGPLPGEPAGPAVTVPACVHMSWSVRPEGDPPAWVQGVLDAEAPGEVEFRRERGRWRVHDWRLVGPEPDGQCPQRCGPDPAGTAHYRERWQPETRSLGPTPTDPPCP